jgi:Alginate export
MRCTVERRCFGFCLALILLAAGASAADNETGNSIRNLEIGFEQRVRNENWNNLFDFSNGADDEREQIRYRTRVWAKAPLTSTIDLFVGLNQETNQKFGMVNRFDEVVFDNAYLDFKRLFVNGLSLRVGRQDLIRGEGFLLLEGNPGDGSRSIYFNAVNLAYSFRKSKLELLGILNPKRDRFLPRFHDQRKILPEWDEQAVGLYYTDNNLSRTSLEGYYFYKKEVNDYRPRTHPQFQPDRHVSTLGGRVVQKIAKPWTAVSEFAAQWGAQHPGVPIASWAGYGYVKRTFDRPWKPYALGGYWSFAGDNPATRDRIEGWDPIFGRWPKWSELYIYSQFPEVGVGYWTNTSMWQAEAGFAPRKPLGLRFTYYHMGAFHPFSQRGPFGSGTRRGEMFQARVDLAAGPNWKGHVLYEVMPPGNFYRDRGTAYFLRFEVIYQVKATLRAGAL